MLETLKRGLTYGLFCD
ncbi:DUF565 domain-containing protein [Candidatus Parcubacteria bacterium]|nr:MAG: DUF565 domain-containing protein [Candidatus Parcubacteria bacterium]